MPTPRPTRPVDPAPLDPAARERLTDRLFAVHRQVFAHPGREAFRDYVIASPADRTRIQAYTDDAGNTVGYFAFHTFHLTIEGVPLAVHRAETGLLGAFRGSAACDRFLAAQLLAAVTRDPGRDHLFFACLTHPSSYCGLSRHIAPVWPCPDQPLPDDVRRRMLALAEVFGLERVPGAGELIRRVGWITHDRGHQQSRWDTSTDPRVVMYRELNPTYLQGTGLLTIIPISLSRIGSGFSANVTYKVTRSLRRLAIRGLAVPQTGVATGEHPAVRPATRTPVVSRTRSDDDSPPRAAPRG